MERLISEFPKQLADSLQRAKALNLKKFDHRIDHVYVAGLGGSGIGGDYVKEIIRNQGSIPYLVGKGYDIPEYIGEHTLFIASSYSGNTEETLMSLQAAIAKNANIVCITTGGRVKEIAEAHGLNLVILPKGESVPRAYLGASLVHQLGAIVSLGIINDEIFTDVQGAIDLIKYDQDEIKVKAKATAEALYGTIPLIYTTDRMESVGVRLRQQINENAKQLTWERVIPEMNHNELVGWGMENKHVAALYLRNKDDFKRNAVRMDINKEIIAKKAHSVIELYSKGSTLLQKMIYFTHLGDWISYYLAEMNGVDAVEVDVIDYLKGSLADVK